MASSSHEVILAATMSDGSNTQGAALATTPDELAQLVCKFARECYKDDEFQSKMRLSDLFLPPDKRPGTTLVLGDHDNDPVRFSEPFLGLWADFAANSERLAPDSIQQYFPGRDLKKLIELAKKHPNHRMTLTSVTDANGKTTSTIRDEPLQPLALERANPGSRVEVEDASNEEEEEKDNAKPVLLLTAGSESPEVPRRSDDSHSLLHGKEPSSKIHEIEDLLQSIQSSEMNDEIAEKLAALGPIAAEVKHELNPRMSQHLTRVYEKAEAYVRSKQENSGKQPADDIHETQMRELLKTVDDVIPELEKAAAFDKIAPKVRELLKHVQVLEKKAMVYDPFMHEVREILPALKHASRNREDMSLKKKIAELEEENRRLQRIVKAHQKSISTAHSLISPSMDLLKENKSRRDEVKQLKEENKTLKEQLKKVESTLPQFVEKFKELSKKVNPTVGVPRTTGLNDELANVVTKALQENKRDALYSRISGGDKALKQLFDRVESKYFSK